MTFNKAITTILCKSIHYYGFTLLTMTDLTAQQRLQLHNYLRNYQHQVAPPEVDDNRLRGAPDFTDHFVINYLTTDWSRYAPTGFNIGDYIPELLAWPQLQVLPHQLRSVRLHSGLKPEQRELLRTTPLFFFTQ